MKKAFRTDNRPYNPFSTAEIEIPVLNDIPADCLRDEKIKGLKRRYPAEQKSKALIEGVISQVWETFACEFDSYQTQICGIFVYDMRECSGIYSSCGGMCSLHSKNRVIIGIDISAVDEEEECLAFLILHEIAHAAGGCGHSPHYEAFLDRMIMIYNQKYGTTIKNDYVTFNDEE